MHSIRCGLLLTLSALRGLCNGRVSVRPSVCPVDRQQQRRAAGLLLSALRAGDMDGYLRAPASRIPAVDRYLLPRDEARGGSRPTYLGAWPLPSPPLSFPLTFLFLSPSASSLPLQVGPLN